MFTRILSLLFLASLLPNISLAQDYVVITGESVNIRIEPSGTVIGVARSGDVFQFKGRDGDWLEILMFSGEYRYVSASLSRRSDSVPPQPGEAVRRRAFQALVRAEDRAHAEADAQIRPRGADIYRNIDLQRVLDDRYKLEVCHRFGIHPAHYGALTIEGVRKGWMP